MRYSVQELAEQWGVGKGTIRRLFRAEPGVIIIRGPSINLTRKFDTLSIPESVAVRVYERLRNTPSGVVDAVSTTSQVKQRPSRASKS